MSDVEQLERRLAARLGRAIGDFELIEPGDRVLVAVSGGKDSWCPGCKDPTLQRHRVKKLLRELERVHPGLKRSLLGALARVDLRSLPIPSRRGARPGDLLPVLEAAMPVPDLEPAPRG